MKLGRLPRAHNPWVPRMEALIEGLAPPILPPECHWTRGMDPNLGMMLNDDLGDCTCAAYMHAIQVWSHHCNPDGLTISEPDSDVLALYEGACGFNPQDPSTDQGGVEQDVLRFLVNEGAPTGPEGKTRHKLAAFFEIDHTKIADVRRAILECGVCYIGFNVPTYLMQSGPPQVWDVQEGEPEIEGGHAVILTGFNLKDDTFDVVSWGKVYQMTSAFFAQFVDETYALIDYDWVDTKHLTPGGISLDDLRAHMKALAWKPKAKAAAE